METNGTVCYRVDCCTACPHQEICAEITDIKTLPVVLKRLVKDQLSQGYTPTPLYLKMLQCSVDNNMPDVHKTLQDQGRQFWQLKLSNKKHQTHKKGTNWDSYAAIMENLHQYTAPTTSGFDNLADFSKTLFLGHFSSDTKGDKPGTIGFVFSTKQMIENAVSASRCQGNDLTVMIDGTYKVLSRGWVLANLGVLCGYYNSITRK